MACTYSKVPILFCGICFPVLIRGGTGYGLEPAGKIVDFKDSHPLSNLFNGHLFRTGKQKPDLLYIFTFSRPLPRLSPFGREWLFRIVSLKY